MSLVDRYVGHTFPNALNRCCYIHPTMTDISLANRTLFMLPGPVKMHPRVLNIMATPALNHRGPEFKDLVKELKELTKYLMQTKDEVAILM